MNRRSAVRLGVALAVACVVPALLGLVLSGPVPAAAGLLAVPRNYPGVAPCDTTLQACINGSAPGDSINIAAGLYITSINLNKAVSLIGAGTGSTFIQALPGQRVITVSGSISGTTQIAGLTVEGGNAGAALGGGILLLGGAQPLLENLNVTANFATQGGGIYATSPLTMLNVIIANNAATNGNGGGIYAASDLAAANSLIQNNSVITNGYGGGGYVAGNFSGSGVDVEDNTVNNGFDGGGLYVNGSLRLSGGQFLRNRVTRQKGYGGGGGLIAFGLTSISGTQFVNNTTADWGGGAYIAYFANTAPSLLTNTSFISNAAVTGGGGLFMWFSSTLSAVDFFSNSAGYRGGGAFAGFSGNYATVVNAGRFVSNTAAGGGGLYSDSSFTLVGTQLLSNTSRSGNGGGAWTVLSATVSNALVAYNTVITGGNSGGIDTLYNLVAANSVFIGNRTLGGSGGGSGAGGTATLSNVQYIGNFASSWGGAVLALGAAQVTNSQFFSNTASSVGGAIATVDVTLNGSRFENNMSTGNWGGGVFAVQSARLTGTLFISNASVYAGGGLATQFNNCNVTGGSFERNRTSGGGWGGALYCGGPSLAITGTRFLTNSAAGLGGGVFGRTTWLSDTTFTNNTTDGYGGGAETFGPAQIVNSRFQANNALLNGGGLSSGSTVLVDQTQFSGNTAGGAGDGSGGGAVAASLSVTATRSMFTGNSTSNGSGGALWTHAGASLADSAFTGNAASNRDGGAVFVAGAATMLNTLFQSNSSGHNGGAVFVSGTLTVSASQWLANLAGAGGGGIYQASGDGRIVNSLFAGNVALGNAGAALNLSPTGTQQILFNTIGAASLISGDAVRINAGTVTFDDNIVTSHATGLDRFGGTVAEDYNLFYGNTLDKAGAISGGTHDVFANPLFVNPAAGNYHLQPGSAAIDAGSDGGVYSDFDGQTRPQNVGFDIGFDELAVWRLYLPLIVR